MSSNSGLTAENKVLTERITALAVEKDELQRENQVITDELQRLREESERQTTLIKKMQDHFRTFDEKIRDKERLREELDQLQIEFDAQASAALAERSRADSLAEELRIKFSSKDEEISRLRGHIDSLERTLTESECDYRRRASETLAEKIQELRRQNDLESYKMKEELKNLYNEKLRQLSRKSDDEMEEKARMVQEIRTLSRKSGKLEEDMAHLLVAVGQKDEAIKDLQARCDRCEDDLQRELAKHESLMRSKEELLASRMSQYHELMEANMTLQAEIQTYHQLLKSEEDRLHLASPTKSPRPGNFPPIKRRRNDENTHENTSALSTIAGGTDFRYVGTRSELPKEDQQAKNCKVM